MFSSLLRGRARARRRNLLRRVKALRERRMLLEPLEPRLVMAAPVGSPNSYSSPVGVGLNIPAPGVLANDYDPDGDPISVYDWRFILQSGGPGGEEDVNWDLHPDGAIDFLPDEEMKPAGALDAGWSSLANFEYRITDGTNISGWIPLSLGTITTGEPVQLEQTIICPTCSCPCKGVKVQENKNTGAAHVSIPSSPSAHAAGPGATGGTGSNASHSSAVATGLAYISNALGVNENIVFDTALGLTPRDEIKAWLWAETFYRGEINFSPAGYSSSEIYRWGFEVDIASKPTDVYEIGIGFRTRSTNGDQDTKRFIGHLVSNNLSDHADQPHFLGRGWSLEAWERLIPVDGDWDGADDTRNDLLWIKGDGNAFVILERNDLPGTFQHPAGDLDYNTVTKINATTFEFLDKYGNLRRFEGGKLIRLDDRFGNRTEFNYTGGLLTSVVDPGGLTTTYTYTSGKLTSMTDFAGRVTTLTYTGSDVTLITQPDPDGAGPLAAPMLQFTYDTMGRITSFTDPDGKVHAYTNTVANTVRRHTFPNTAYTELTARHSLGFVDGPYFGPSFPFNPLFKTVDVIGSWRDELGRVTTFLTDRLGQLTMTSGPAGLHTFVRNGDGQLVTHTLPDADGAGPEGQLVHSYSYDSKANLLSESLFSGASTQSWNVDQTKFSQVSSHTDARGLTTTFTLDSQGKATQSQQVVGGITSTTTYTYTSTGVKGLVASVTDALGTLTTFTYNAHALPTTIVEASGTALAATTTLAYDAYDRVQTVTDPLSRVTTYGYDLLDRLLTLTLPDPDAGGPLASPVVTYEYDILSRRRKEIDPLGRATFYDLDVVHNLTHIRRPDHDNNGQLTITEYVWDYGHRNTSVIDPLGRTTAYQYNDRDDLVQTTLADPDGAGPLAAPIWMWGYDILSRNTNQIDPRLSVTEYAYQNVWRNVTATLPDPDGAGGPLTTSTVSSVMNAAGDVTSATDELGRLTSFYRDMRGLLIQLALPDPDGAGSQGIPVWNYVYNKLGQAVSVQDAASNSLTLTEYFYDARRRLTEVRGIDPDGYGPLGRPSTFYTYDAASQLTSVTDPKGNVTNYEYDNLGRLKKLLEADPDGVGPLTRSETVYTYNAASELTSVTDALGHVTSYQYDTLGHLKKGISPDPDGGGPLAAPEVNYTYDAASQLLSVSDPLNHVTSYQYDNLGRTTRVTQPDSAYTQFTYDALDNVKSLTDPVGNATQWDYDFRQRTTSETNALGKIRSFKYDATDNLIERTDRNGRVIQWTYDNLDRVTDETWVSGSRTISYVWDAMDRLNKASDPSATYRYGYHPSGDQFIETQEIAGLTNIAYERVFDLSGNVASVSAKLGVTVSQFPYPGYAPMISGGTFDYKNEFTYDGLNRVTKITQQGQSGGNSVAAKRVDFAYNKLHQFTTIDRYHNTAGTQLVAHTDYAYDGMNRLASIAHSKGSNNLGTFSYTWDAASRLTGRVDTYTNSAWNATHGYTYSTTDQLTAATHSAGQPNESYGYDSNGNRNTAGHTTGANNQTSTDGVYNYLYDDEGNRTKRTKISNGEYEEYSWDYRNRMTKVVKKSVAHAVLSQVDLEYNYLNRLVKEVIDVDGAGSGVALDRYFSWEGDQIALQWDEVSGSNTLTHRYLWGPMVDQLFTDEEISTGYPPGSTNRWALTDHVNSVRDLVTYNSGTDTTTNIKHRDYNAFGKTTVDSAPTVQALTGFQGVLFEVTVSQGYFRHRWMDFELGQWTGPDPITFTGGDMNLRRAMGNHLTYGVDPSGLREPNAEERKELEKLRQIVIERNRLADLATVAHGEDSMEHRKAYRSYMLAYAVLHQFEGTIARQADAGQCLASTFVVATVKAAPATQYDSAAVPIMDGLMVIYVTSTVMSFTVADRYYDLTGSIRSGVDSLLSEITEGTGDTAPTKPKNGETEHTARGRKAHKEREYGPGYEKERTLPSGKRPDAVNEEEGKVIELKPNNRRAIRRGEKQVKEYCEELSETTGKPFTGTVETYDP